MLVWMFYVVLVSTALSLAAFMLERTALLRRVPTRWVWALSIIMCLLLPIIISSVSLPQFGTIGHKLTALPPQSLPLRQLTSTELSPALWLNNIFGPVGTGADIDRLLQVTWLTASGIMLLALVAGMTQLHIRKRSWQQGMMCDACVYIAEDTGPAIVGLFRPRIVVPRWLTSCDRDDQTIVILHETSHLAAHDAQLLAFVLLLVAAMPWNFPVWWQLKRLRYAIEVDCDARLLRRGLDIPRYGNVLITVGAQRSRNIGVVAAMAESGSFLEHRIHHMLRRPHSMVSLSVMTAASLAFCFAFFAAQIRPPTAVFTGLTGEGMTSAGTTSAEIMPAASELDQYAGYYHISGDMVLTVWRNGNQLSIRFSGEATPLPLVASALGKFSYKPVNIQLSFVTDGQGKISALDFRQNDFTRRMLRIDGATAKQYIDLLAAKVQNQTPYPGSRAAVLQILDTVKSGQPDYRGVAPGAVALAKKTIFNNEALVHDVADFTDPAALKFSAVTPGGADVYELKLRGVMWHFSIFLDRDGSVSAFMPWQ